ncbi:hypothetical protein Cadr_000001856 [Camelus dromedarius]|uniref:Uncharacterized protein n=1 Tax=Camelus dromedarius TaxID=9838 RepID=A0A5N4EGJ3_CAMDR|nr:hypothetical protein Cadr_000001856 [Camelus dromedarius]
MCPLQLLPAVYILEALAIKHLFQARKRSSPSRDRTHIAGSGDPLLMLSGLSTSRNHPARYSRPLFTAACCRLLILAGCPTQQTGGLAQPGAIWMRQQRLTTLNDRGSFSLEVSAEPPGREESSTGRGCTLGRLSCGYWWEQLIRGTELETDRSESCGLGTNCSGESREKKEMREEGKGVTVIRRAFSTPPLPSPKAFKDLSDEQ